jgi:hypothetical protein
VPFAAALALTQTASLDAKPAVERRMEVAFDNPTPFTKRAVGTMSANKATLVAKVFIKDVQAGYLELEETGGTRRPKRRSIVVPVGQRRNRYGNMSKDAIAKLMARKDVFVGRVGGTPGIWQRRKGGVKLLILFKEETQYEPRFGFEEAVERAALSAFPRRFEAALMRAFASAR